MAFKIGDIVIEKKHKIQYGITDNNTLCKILDVLPSDNHSRTVPIIVKPLFTREGKGSKWKKYSGNTNFDVDGSRFIKAKLPNKKEIEDGF